MSNQVRTVLNIGRTVGGGGGETPVCPYRKRDATVKCVMLLRKDGTTPFL